MFRRLRQDVAGFHEFLDHAVTQAGPGVTRDKLAADVVGRWPSGAPVARTPTRDVPELGVDALRNDHFGFGSDSRTLRLTDGSTTNGLYPEAGADPVGLVCPQFAHIRKVNSRTAPNDAGGLTASFTRRILRRGLPYGKPTDEDRGLLFLSVQASIVDQFEFLNTRWMGDRTNPRAPGGHDLFIGQNGQPGEDRVRSATLLRPDGAHPVTAPRDYVTATGGGYFFVPSLSALRDVLGS